jgi:MFS family permease
MDREPRALTVAFAGLAALAVAMGIGRFAFTPILPMMQGDYGLSVAGGGWLASANYAGYLVGALSAVWLRASSTTVIRGSLVLIAAVTAGMGLTESFSLWIVLRAAAGVASAWVLVFVSAWALDRLALYGRPLYGSIVFAGVGAGMALAGGLCLLLMRSGAASPQAWLVLGVASLAIAALTAPVFGTPVTAHVDRPVGVGRYRWTRDGVLIVVCYGVFGFGYIIPATFVPAMAKQIVSDPAVFGWSWPLFGLAAMASTIGAARFMGALGNRRVWVVCSLVMAVGVAAPALVPGLIAIMVAAVCVGATFVVVTMVGMQEARKVGGAHSRTLMAAMTASFAAGQIAGPLTVSLFAHSGVGMNAVLIAAALLLVASAGTVAWSSIDERKAVEALPE